MTGIQRLALRTSHREVREVSAEWRRREGGRREGGEKHENCQREQEGCECGTRERGGQERAAREEAARERTAHMAASPMEKFGINMENISGVRLPKGRIAWDTLHFLHVCSCQR